jgi:predicted Zn finger-like uncharacterized protein
MAHTYHSLLAICGRHATSRFATRIATGDPVQHDCALSRINRMRIECPHCAAIYDVPEERLEGRKAVRCARCGTEFVPGQEAAMPEEPPWPEPVIETEAPKPELTEEPVEAEPQPRAPLSRQGMPSISAMQRLAQSASPPPRSTAPLIAWIASLVFVALLIWAAVNWRADIMQAWPPSTRAYAALGLTR